jgi:hypothetical protein
MRALPIIKENPGNAVTRAGAKAMNYPGANLDERTFTLT